MKKIIFTLLAALIITALLGCAKNDLVSDTTKTYEITSEIHSLDIQINAADFVIKQSDEFSVESNLKYLSVTEKDGVLRIIDEAKNSKFNISNTYSDPVLTLCIPDGTVFEDVDIETGACKLTSCTLSANSIELFLGAGDVYFEGLHAASDIEIEGGAGKITIDNGTLNDLTLEMGVGELNLTAALLGNSDLEFGIGESNLTLIGSEDEYQINVQKGFGSITIDGKSVNHLNSSGNGQNRVELDGGIGAINLNFQTE